MSDVDVLQKGKGELVQETLFPIDAGIDALYLRYITGYSEVSEDILRMDKGAKVSFNTYFNSFYESYWADITCVRDLILEIEFSGSIVIEVFRDTKHNGVHRIAFSRFDADSPEIRTIKLGAVDSAIGETGRLFVDITTRKKSQVSGLRFKTSTLSRCQPKISIGICTFNREKFLLRNLHALIALPSLKEGLAKIVVVNQGPQFALPELVELVSDSDRILLVEQSNLGGCGGFTRTMHEALKLDGITHHILMDDDAVFDARVFQNLLALLAYANDDLIVGGHMLDLMRPHFLYEAGAEVKSNTRIKPLHRNIDLRVVDSLIPFNKYHAVDYNAWWFCAIPVEHIRAVDFSAPIFIRGDDMEYGLRLQERGVKTVAMPGVAVWAEPEDISKGMSAVVDVLFSEDEGTKELYLRTLHGLATVKRDQLNDNKHSLFLQEGAKISLNTYFNSFYEDYWDALTDCTDLSIELEGSGSVTLEAFRDTKSSGCHRILEVEIEFGGVRKELIELPVLNGVAEAGRVFFDITARNAACIRSMRLLTSTETRRKPLVTVGICTFNREKFLVRNLRELLALPTLEDGLAKIVVVNQGAPFSTPELVDLVRNTNRVLLVEQGNLGGCGGFTRTMYEALEVEGVTHHVLMDDDALIDVRVLSNLFLLLAHIRDGYAIGGHMLDLLRPNILYEAGAQVKSNTRIKSLHHNIDLRAVDSLIPFNKYHAVDYNAWWFCAIPVEHIRAVDFPAPIFIRGDDMEYGLRLQERGVKTVAMPGIAVWHEPFYVKVGGWQTYYDLRNRLILASTYPHRFKHESPTDVLWWMLKAAASHDYLTATLLAKAVKDFLYGPSFFEKGADAIHGEVSALTKSLAQPSVAENELPEPPAKLHRMPKSDWAHGLLAARRIAMTLLFANKSGAMRLLDHEANLSNIGPRPYVKTNGIGSYRLRYEPNRRRLIQVLADSFGAWSAYRRQRHAAAKAWGEQIPKLRNPVAWQAIFDADASRRENDRDKPKAD